MSVCNSIEIAINTDYIDLFEVLRDIFVLKVRLLLNLLVRRDF